MESAGSVSLLIKLSVACCKEARGALTTPKCSRHASQTLTPELQVATEDWRLKKRFTGIMGRVPRLKLPKPIENGDREDVEDICKATRIRCSIREECPDRTILEVAVAMRVAFVLDFVECFRDGTARSRYRSVLSVSVQKGRQQNCKMSAS